MSWFWFVAFALMFGWNCFLMWANADLADTIARLRRREHDHLVLLRGGVSS